MKRCPYCAEEIQDEAIVCKHCGRDLKEGASQVQLIAPKKKTSPLAWGCLAVILILAVLFVIGLMIPKPRQPERPAKSKAASKNTAAPPATSPSRPAPAASKWTRVGVDRSAMDDSVTVAYSLVADNRITDTSCWSS